MDALVVLFIVLIGLRLIGTVLYLLVSRASRMSPGEAGTPAARIDPCLAPIIGLPPEPLASAESDLYAKLASGAINRDQYRDAMAALAVRDDESRHLEVPTS